MKHFSEINFFLFILLTGNVAHSDASCHYLSQGIGVDFFYYVLYYIYIIVEVLRTRIIFVRSFIFHC